MRRKGERGGKVETEEKKKEVKNEVDEDEEKKKIVTIYE